MAYYKHRFAVRWSNGDVEGFVGTGTSRKSAGRNARALAAVKAIHIGAPVAMYTGRAGLTDDEFELVRSDWRVADRAGRAAEYGAVFR